MTDEKIIEAFKGAKLSIPNLSDRDIVQDTVYRHFAIGFRIAERLAKIEVLEELLDYMNLDRIDRQGNSSHIRSMLSELKGGK